MEGIGDEIGDGSEELADDDGIVLEARLETNNSSLQLPVDGVGPGHLLTGVDLCDEDVGPNLLKKLCVYFNEVPVPR